MFLFYRHPLSPLYSQSRISSPCLVLRTSGSDALRYTTLSRPSEALWRLAVPSHPSHSRPPHILALLQIGLILSKAAFASTRCESIWPHLSCQNLLLGFALAQQHDIACWRALWGPFLTSEVAPLLHKRYMLSDSRLCCLGHMVTTIWHFVSPRLLRHYNIDCKRIVEEDRSINWTQRQRTPKPNWKWHSLRVLILTQNIKQTAYDNKVATNILLNLVCYTSWSDAKCKMWQFPAWDITLRF